MSKITGIGGVFIYSPQKNELIDWYKKVLEIDLEDWGATISTQKSTNDYQVFSIMNGDYFPKSQRYMINFVIDDLEDFVEKLKAKNIEVKNFSNNEYGKFAHIEDLDKNLIELWQPPAK